MQLAYWQSQTICCSLGGLARLAHNLHRRMINWLLPNRDSALIKFS
jgi:hypothetical protein